LARSVARQMHEDWHFYRYDSSVSVDFYVDCLVSRLYDEVYVFLSDHRHLLEFTHQGLYSREFLDGEFVYLLLCREGFGLYCWIFDWDSL
jgi:hypothetical protein